MMTNRLIRRAAVLASVALCPATTLAASADVLSQLRAPVLKKLEGGLKVGNLRYASPRSIYAYPLQSPPVVGFQPFVAVTLTDRQGSDDFSTLAIPQVTRTGNLLPRNQPEYTYLATLDSGGQSHILSAEAAAMIDLEGSGRAGGYQVEVSGASGSEFLDVSDPLGVFVSGTQNITNTTTLQAPASSYVGQIHTSVLTAGPGSVLPSIIGVPMLGHYAADIKNSQTRRLTTSTGAVRSPAVNFVPHGDATQYQFRLELDLQDPLGSSTSGPTFFPSLDDFDDFSDNPTAPTFWTFPIANTNLTHTGGSVSQQQFLFDTGAQVSVVSEATADAIGFDVGTDTPDFFIDVLGVGGTRQVPGFFVQRFELPVTGGSAIFQDVPVVVLNVTDPRDGVGFIPGIIGMNLFNDRDLSVNMQPSNPYVRFSAPYTAQWNVDGNGTWVPDSNWVLGVPDGIDVQANFLNKITAARTVTVDGNYTIGSMKFDNANSYTLTGSGRLTFGSLGRPSKIDVVTGSHTISARLTFDVNQTIHTNAGTQLTLSGDHASPDSNVKKTGAGTLRLSNARYESLTIEGGTVQILAGTGDANASKLEALMITAGALDITNAKLIANYSGPIPASEVRSDILSGAIFSSLASSSKAIGYGTATELGLASFGGLQTDADSILLRLTLKGDANLSGNVNFDDLLALAQNYGSSSAVWTRGDFDYNGVVTFDDLLALAQNYGGSASVDVAAQFGEAFAADWKLAQSLVPEPASLGLLSIAAFFAPRRRSQRYN